MTRQIFRQSSVKISAWAHTHTIMRFNFKIGTDHFIIKYVYSSSNITKSLLDKKLLNF